MTYSIVPTVLTSGKVAPLIVNDASLAGQMALATHKEPMLKNSVVFGNPLEVAKQFPAVLDFFNGKTDSLPVEDLVSFTKALGGSVCGHEDNSRSLIIGAYVLGPLPQEQDKSFFQKAFDVITGTDTALYFDKADLPIVEGFLTNIMSIPSEKISISPATQSIEL